jgi:hypothetical protein
MRPVLPADNKFSPCFAFLAKTRPKPPFGNPRAFQPPKQNIVIFRFIFVHIDSHSTFYLALSLILFEVEQLLPTSSLRLIFHLVFVRQ